MTGRSWLAATAGGLTLAGMLTLMASPAQGAAAALELSADGVAYAAAFPGTVLDVSRVIVPGDSLSGTVWLRNSGAADGWVRITLRAPTAGSDGYVRALALTATAGGERGATTALPGTGECAEVLAVRRLAAGAAIAVDIRLSFADVDGTTAQGSAVRVPMVAVMSETAAGAAATGCAPPAVAAGAGSAPVGAVSPPSAGVPPWGDEPDPEVRSMPLWTVEPAWTPLAAAVIVLAGLVGAALRLYSERRKDGE